MRTAQTSNSQNGFTLIELLIVIVILAILAGVILNLLDVEEYRKQARDARRLNDILVLQTAILGAIANSDIALIDNRNCSSCNSYTGTSDSNGEGWVTFTNVSGKGLKNMVSSLPQDPINNATYNFSFYSDGNSFELNTKLESKKYEINAIKDGGNNVMVYERGLKLDIK